MKKILLLIAAPFVFFTAQADLITQPEADGIVLERLNQETRPYTLYAKEDVQQKMSITTVDGEVLDVNYKFWCYYVNYIDNTGQYIIVKESNGNVLMVNVMGDAMPEDLEKWKVVESTECSVWKCTEYKDVIFEFTFYPSVNKLHIKSTPEELGYPHHYLFVGSRMGGYCIINNKLYGADENGNFNFNGNDYLIITHLSENEIIIEYGGVRPAVPNYIEIYHFVCQTKFTRI